MHMCDHAVNALQVTAAVQLNTKSRINLCLCSRCKLMPSSTITRHHAATHTWQEEKDGMIISHLNLPA